MSDQAAQIVTVDPTAPDTDTLERLGAALRGGALVAFPTETVYGLGADATNPDAVARIFTAKGRPGDDPLIVHIADLADLAMVTGRPLIDLPPVALRLAAAFWPGPLTLVLPRGPAIPDIVTSGLPTVGVRMPAHDVALGLIAAAGVPVAAPSANRFGHTSPTTAEHVRVDLGDRIEWILDGGPCAIGIESTILDVTQTPQVLLRPGGVPVEAIEAELGSAIARRARQVASGGAAASSPGQAVTHYAPRARMVLVEGDDPVAVRMRMVAEIRACAATGERVGALVPAEWVAAVRAAGAVLVWDLGSALDTTTAARRLYAGLRMLDGAGVAVIMAASFAESGLGLALSDRLWRAAGGRVIKA